MYFQIEKHLHLVIIGGLYFAIVSLPGHRLNYSAVRNIG